MAVQEVISRMLDKSFEIITQHVVTKLEWRGPRADLVATWQRA